MTSDLGSIWDRSGIDLGFLFLFPPTEVKQLCGALGKAWYSMPGDRETKTTVVDNAGVGSLQEARRLTNLQSYSVEDVFESFAESVKHTHSVETMCIRGTVAHATGQSA